MSSKKAVRRDRVVGITGYLWLDPEKVEGVVKGAKSLRGSMGEQKWTG